MSAYLDGLDLLLADGLAPLPGAFTARQVAFVLQQQRADGGFRGRQGTSDPYYTDFTLRTLTLLAPDAPALPRAATYLGALAPPADVVDVFSRLNAARLLARCGITPALDTADYPAVLARQCAPFGGYTRPSGREVSAYDTFLALLCHGLLCETYPPSAADALATLRRADGGYAALAGEAASQTNATAAAAGALTLLETELSAHTLIGFLGQQQAPDGGLRAHPALPGGDLLSTFTGLLTLVGLGGTEALDLPALARFVKASAHPAGGFTAGPLDTEADVEYTYYGLGCLALLRLQAESGA